jgi:pimeloyl-ACP methyl ester carboxylesterase
MVPGWRACLEADHDASQGPGAWQRLFFEAFGRWSQHLPYHLEDFASIEVPMLVSVGDRDRFCTVEESCAAYRNLPHGELSITPGVGHAMTPAVAAAALDFFARNS